ncbi:peptidase inhibitor family I36 protein [Kitasatospora kifunensis]|uniref:Peptidase inhibitor family I36 n=1 Tax=Kitasatospora kifunensis TaxID=58351 RepID=A0A7W7VZM8_KITKI|nr:peptidase inhibitor family I36 protein [Kitasatospora kifunensis]MBB4927855.1 hypothetical protein [Kitasatospora kifunensis]
MLKRVLSAATVLLGVTTCIAVAPSAEAVAPPYCNSGALCAYYGSNYSDGSPQQVYQNNTDLTMYDLFYNIQGGSLYNNGKQCNVTVYTGKSYTGASYPLNRGTGWKAIGSNLPHIESNYWC